MNLTDYHLVTLAALLHDVGKFFRAQSDSTKTRKKQSYGFQEKGGHAADSVNLMAHLGATQLADWQRLRELILHHHSHQWATGNEGLGWLITSSDWYSSSERLDELEEESGPQLESIFQQVKSVYPKPEKKYHWARAQEPANAFPRSVAPTPDQFDSLLDKFETEGANLLQQVQEPAHLIVGFTELLKQYATTTSAAKESLPRDVSLFDHLSTTAAITACQYLYHAQHNQWDIDLSTECAQKKFGDEKKFLLIGADLSGIQNYLYEIAGIGAGGVAKRLRARSFYLTMLQDVIALRLRQELVSHLGAALPPNALLIDTGGRFVMLAPNLPEVCTQLDHLDQAINRWLREETHGDLACYFAKLPLAGSHFAPEQKVDSGESITAKMAQLYGLLDEQKERRYESLLWSDGWQRGKPTTDAESVDSFVQRHHLVEYLPGDGRDAGGACRSCQKLPVDGNVRKFLKDRNQERSEEDREKENLCRRCFTDLELGRCLIRGRYIGYRTGQPQQRLDTSAFVHEEPRDQEWSSLDLVFFDNGTDEQAPYTVRVTDSRKWLDNFGPESVDYLAQEKQCYVTADDQDPKGTRYDEYRQEATALSFDYPLRWRYLANYVPTREQGGRPKIRLFEELAQSAGRAKQSIDEESVEALLGAVKMDVDQLGFLLNRGLGEATSISRLATFSRSLDLFFSGWVDTKLRRPCLHDEKGNLQMAYIDEARQPTANPYRDMYTVYAGGDDLLLVGPWDQAILAAQELQADFTRYTCHNPNLTVSAAVVVFKPKYPVARAAQQASDYLDERAKELGRNRFHLFGVTAPWYHREAEEDTRFTDNRGLSMEQLWEWATFFDDHLYCYRSLKGTGPPYPFSNQLVHRILELSQMAQRLESGQSALLDDLTYMAKLAYIIGRNVTDKRVINALSSELAPGDLYQNEAEAARTYQEMAKQLNLLTDLSHRQEMAHLQMALTWALYRNRIRSSDDIPFSASVDER